MKPQLSVIVPVYNTQTYLPECLESLIAQSLRQRGANALEVLLINDASTDGSLALLQRYQSKYPALFKIIDQPENRGLGAVRNVAMAQAQGDYIGFVDSDDRVHPEMFETMVAAAQASSADYVQAGMCLFDEQRMEPIATTSLAESTSVCNKIFKHDFVQQHQLRFAQGELFEDEVFSYLAEFYSDNSQQLAQDFYYYRANPNGICRSAQGDSRRLLGRMTCLVDFLETFKQRELLPQLQQRCLEVVCRHALLQLAAHVSWSELVGYWRFSAHLIQRYRLATPALLAEPTAANSYFVQQFFKLSNSLSRLWLLRQYTQLRLALLAIKARL